MFFKFILQTEKNIQLNEEKASDLIKESVRVDWTVDDKVELAFGVGVVNTSAY